MSCKLLVYKITFIKMQRSDRSAFSMIVFKILVEMVQVTIHPEIR